MKIAMTLMLMGGLGATACTEEELSVNDAHIELSARVGDAMTRSVGVTVRYQDASFRGLYLAFDHTEWLQISEGERVSGRGEFAVSARTEGMAAGTYEARATFWVGPSASSPDVTTYVDVTLTVKP